MFSTTCPWTVSEPRSSFFPQTLILSSSQLFPQHKPLVLLGHFVLRCHSGQGQPGASGKGFKPQVEGKVYNTIHKVEFDFSLMFPDDSGTENEFYPSGIERIQNKQFIKLSKAKGDSVFLDWPYEPKLLCAQI